MCFNFWIRYQNCLCNKCFCSFHLCNSSRFSRIPSPPIMSWRIEMDAFDILRICCVRLGAGTSKTDACLELSVQSTRSFSNTDSNSNFAWVEYMQYYYSILYDTVEQRESNGKKIHYTQGKRSLSKALLTHIFTSCLDEHHSNISPPGIFLHLCVLTKRCPHKKVSLQKGVITKVVRLLTLLNLMF